MSSTPAPMCVSEPFNQQWLTVGHGSHAVDNFVNSMFTLLIIHPLKKNQAVTSQSAHSTATTSRGWIVEVHDHAELRHIKTLTLT